jgi:peptidoglycan/LPS O-acetylase OafA/YrhL
VQALGGAALLILLLDGDLYLSRLFRAPSLRYLGKISYGVYLFHSLVFAAFLRSHFATTVIASGSALAAIGCLIGEFAIVLGIATVSFYFFESPILRLKKYFEPESSTTDKNERMDVHSVAVGA